MNLLSILLWVPVLAVKIVLILAGLIICIRYRRGLYRTEPNRPDTWWEAAIRNPVGGFNYLLKPRDSYREYGALREPVFDTPFFQWRFRRAGLLSSLRIVVKWDHSRYGEMYLGWKLGSPPGMDFAASLRPFSKVGQ